MRKFSIEVRNLGILYNHYLNTVFIKNKRYTNGFKINYPLNYYSRRFDKPALKYKNGICIWWLDNEMHRVGKPADIHYDGRVWYYENGIKKE